VRVARELGHTRSRERTILDALRSSLPADVVDDVQTQVSEYHAVLDRELGLLGVGKTSEALRLERQETDPRFGRLNQTLQDLETRAVAAADQANHFADLALGAAMALAAAAIGFLLYRFEREHRATTRANEEMLVQQRLAIDTLAEHEALIRHQASHDPLTGLPNRRRLSELLEPGTPACALLLVDLDDYKPVNDRLGHAAGDELLIAVASRLLSVVRAGDTVVRLGGDEFAIVLGDGDESTTVRVAERVVAVVGEPFDVAGTVVRVGASVGCAINYDHCDGTTLLGRADGAMYQVKQASKGGYELYREAREEMSTA